MSVEKILRSDPQRLFEQVVEAAKPYEFHSFVLGIERPKDYSREEHEAAFRDLKIRIGRQLSELWPGRCVDFDRPEARIEIRALRRGEGARVRVRAAPFFLGGRYLKFSREIPACRWMHHPCKGRGCEKCNFTGNVHGPSIQELAAPAILAATGGEETFFHGAGREDVDARMLGSGRPFVVEVREPRRRQLDFESLRRQINESAEGLAEVRVLAQATREQMILAKAAAAEKTYRARIRFGGDVPGDLEERLAGLAGREIEQLSPQRVMRRRGADTVRLKRVIESKLVGRDGDEFIWEVRAASGTYIKELISSDDGRTKPSVASVAGVPCECTTLDVLAVHWKPPWEKV